ncbi:MAG: hypothetical protein E7589_00570 [Ruminococcaceae bacterium]|nr:hypothetical protein [Oscillospiraceae bacterium]
MLRLITGRSGSGKTQEIISMIRTAVSEGKNTLLIVPEQQVYSCERNILPQLPTSAGLNFEILSFSRLAQKVASIYGGVAGKVPSQSIKTLLMWRNLREVSDVLEEFGKVSSSYSSDATLTSLMLATVNELKHSGVSADQLISIADNLDEGSPLGAKFRDIAVVSTAYDLLLKGIYGENPADRLTLAAEQIRENEFFRDTTVFVDSFTSFTAQEYDILRSALFDADELCVALCADKEGSDAVHFLSTLDTKKRLCKIAAEYSESVEIKHLDGNVRTQSRELRALEENLWNFKLSDGLSTTVPVDSRGDVTLLTAENVYDEAEAAALNIRDIVKQGIPYENIAILVRDTTAWEGILDAALESYGIPYFVSERTSVATKPLSRLLLSSLRAISRGWQTADVMDVLKTGLCNISVDDVDMFEEYVFTWSISGRKMTEAVWNMNPDGYTVEMSERGRHILEAANRVRTAIMTPLIALKSDLEASESVTEQCRAIYAYLTSLDVKQRQIERAESLIARDKIKDAGEELRLWSFVSESLVSLSTVMENCKPMRTDELEGALNILFTSTDMGSVPARHDCVIIGSAKTLRADNIKAALVLGLCESEFPSAPKPAGVFTDSDREFLANHGISLGSDADIDSSEELMYVYRALSMPSEKLYASYNLCTTEGKKKIPSVAFARMAKLFDYANIKNFKTSMIYDRQQLASHGAAVRRAYRNVSGATAKSILGDKLYLSQTKIKRFFSCPYSYYASYVLKLRERERAELGSLSSGLFLHHVVEHFLRRTLDENNSIKPLSDDEVQALAEEIIAEYVRELCVDMARLGSVIHLFGRMRTVAIALINSVIAELRQSQFRPFGFEVKFDEFTPNSPAPMTIDLDLAPESETSDPVKLIFGGTADRIDFYRKDDKIFIRVIDYKSSAHDIDFSEGAFEKDLNVQLLIYMFAICSPQNKRLFANTPTDILPASAMYVSYGENTSSGTVDIKRTGLILDTSEILRATSSELDRQFLPGISFNKDGTPRGKALCPQDRMDALEAELRDALSDTASRLYGGIAERTPSDTACTFCVMKDSCPSCVRSKNQF